MRPTTAASAQTSTRRGGSDLGVRVAAIRIIHPFPTLLNVAATTGLAAVAADGWPPGWLLVRMLLMMFFAQSAIGATNDLFDVELDARAKPSKPIPSSAISRTGAAIVAVACALSAIGFAATLGTAAFALALLGLACGLAYDAGLKRSVASAVPFMIAIPTLPLWVWVSVDRWVGVLLWIVPLGALIGLALHLANTLPDIESDAANGVRGLAHRLGERGSMLLAWSSFGGALTLAGLIAPAVSYDMRIFLPTLGGGALCLALSIALGASRESASLQAAFGVMGVGAAAAAVGWLAAAT